MTSQFRSVAVVLIAALATTLVACGGGGAGGSTSATSEKGANILDSFGLAVGSSEGFGGGDSGADGSAGDGSPIVGGAVVVTDAAGKSVATTTNSAGYYRVKVNGFMPPFVAKVTKTDGAVRYSLNIKPIVANGFVTMNISGMTDKIASDVAVAGGKTGAAQLTPQIVAANLPTINKSIGDIRNQFSDVIAKAGIVAATFDPIGVPFLTNHTGYDNVLDNTVVSINASGATQLAVAPIYRAPDATATNFFAVNGAESYPLRTSFSVSGSGQIIGGIFYDFHKIDGTMTACTHSAANDATCHGSSNVISNISQGDVIGVGGVASPVTLNAGPDSYGFTFIGTLFGTTWSGTWTNPGYPSGKSGTFSVVTSIK